jgi:DtxR family Mn-dependent transcriptional regulator
MEDYLKVVFLLRERGEEIGVQSIAQALDVSAPSVTGMVKRLAGLGLLDHQPYQAIALTAAGEAVALEIVRHHRLIELYLTEYLGMSWDTVHHDADRLEHHISEDLEERIAAQLGQPSFDPHGDPIPNRELVLPARAAARLSDLEPGTTGEVARIELQDPAVLQYLQQLGIRPGVLIRLMARAPFGGVVQVGLGPDVDGAARIHALGGDLARHILVTGARARVEDGT